MERSRGAPIARSGVVAVGASGVPASRVGASAIDVPAGAALGVGRCEGPTRNASVLRRADVGRRGDGAAITHGREAPTVTRRALVACRAGLMRCRVRAENAHVLMVWHHIQWNADAADGGVALAVVSVVTTLTTGNPTGRFITISACRCRAVTNSGGDRHR
jgi:hypothetical protein